MRLVGKVCMILLFIRLDKGFCVPVECTLKLDGVFGYLDSVDILLQLFVYSD